MSPSEICPNCGETIQMPVMAGVTVEGNAGGGIVVGCPSCGQDTDFAPQDGTYSNLLTGRLRKIADLVKSTPPDELAELKRRIEQLETDRDDEAAAAVLDDAGIAPKGGRAWLRSRENRQEMWTVLALLVSIITAVLAQAASHDGLDKDDVERIVREINDERPSAPPSSPGPAEPPPTMGL